MGKTWIVQCKLLWAAIYYFLSNKISSPFLPERKKLGVWGQHWKKEVLWKLLTWYDGAVVTSILPLGASQIGQNPSIQSDPSGWANWGKIWDPHGSILGAPHHHGRAEIAVKGRVGTLHGTKAWTQYRLALLGKGCSHGPTCSKSITLYISNIL